MGIVHRILTVVLVLLGGGLFSQAPEFTQQYRQRIGGALDELHTIVTAFEQQASQFGLSRNEALATYAASQSPFLEGQGATMRATIDRYTALSMQQAELSREPAVTRPLLLLRRFDVQIARNAWHDFVPAMPMGIAGLFWAFAGCLCGWAASLVPRSFGQKKRVRSL